MTTTLRYAATYGILSGLIIIAVIVSGISLAEQVPLLHSMWFGYLVMLVALTFIFVGVKRYRDVEMGGVIRFARAFGIGLAIAVAAGLAYVLVWEVYLAATDYAFMNDYIDNAIAALRADGVSGEALASQTASLESMRVQYRDPLFRLPVTFLEIFPVGLIVSLVSASLLRNPKVFPAVR